MVLMLVITSILFLILDFTKVVRGYAYYTPSLMVAIYSFFIGLACLNIFTSDFANFWSNRGVVNNSYYVSIYTMFILFSYQIFTFFSEKTIGKSQINYSSFFKIFKETISIHSFRFFCLFILLLTLVYVYYLNFNIVWLNSQYLLIQSLDALKDKNIISVTLQMLSPLLGLLSILLFGLAIRLKDNFSLIIIFLPAFFYFLLRVADHSRLSAVYAAILVVVFLSSKIRFQKYFLAPLFTLIFFGNLLNSLVGRSSYEHGIFSVLNYLDNIFYGLNSGEVFNIFSNIFEGAFVHGESITYFNYNYPIIFKILSLSPFPNFIDEYQERASQYSLRLNTYVPMGATGEILIFGIWYIVFYFILIFLSIRANICALKKQKYFIFIVSLFLLVLATYLQFTYPLRNMVRFYYLAIFIYYLSDFFTRVRWGK